MPDRDTKVEDAKAARDEAPAPTKPYHLKGTEADGTEVYATVEGEDLEHATAVFQGQAASTGHTYQTVEEVTAEEVKEANEPPPQEKAAQEAAAAYSAAYEKSMGAEAGTDRTEADIRKQREAELAEQRAQQKSAGR